MTDSVSGSVAASVRSCAGGLLDLVVDATGVLLNIFFWIFLFLAPIQPVILFFQPQLRSLDLGLAASLGLGLAVSVFFLVAASIFRWLSRGIIYRRKFSIILVCILCFGYAAFFFWATTSNESAHLVIVLSAQGAVALLYAIALIIALFKGVWSDG